MSENNFLRNCFAASCSPSVAKITTAAKTRTNKQKFNNFTEIHVHVCNRHIPVTQSE